MKKCGGFFTIIGIIVLALLVVIAGAGIYFYNFHVFKTVRICVGESNNTQISCDETQDCLDLVVGQDFDVDFENVPEFARESLQGVVDEAIYCDNTCFVKNIRGVDLETQALEMLESCDNDEVEFKIDIRGKDGIEILKWLKEKEL